MDSMIKFKKDVAPILESIEKLTPWDRNELVVYLLNNLDGEFSKLAEVLGFVDSNDIDPVKEVMDAGLETDVLDEMPTYEILDYLFSNWSDCQVFDIISRVSAEDISENISRREISKLLDCIYKEHRDEFDDWLYDKKGEN